MRIPVLLLLLLIEAIGATCTDDGVDDVEDDIMQVVMIKRSGRPIFMIEDKFMILDTFIVGGDVRFFLFDKLEVSYTFRVRYELFPIFNFMSTFTMKNEK